jgi:hypothetical protein
MEDLVEPSRIALLGATSPLGKDLEQFGISRGHAITVFSRNPGRGQSDYIDFEAGSFDLVLNLIGGHRDSLSKEARQGILDFDARVLKACDMHSVPYAHLSSGAVFGSLAEPANRFTDSGDYALLSDYGKLKVDLEVYHCLLYTSDAADE